MTNTWSKYGQGLPSLRSRRELATIREIRTEDSSGTNPSLPYLILPDPREYPYEQLDKTILIQFSVLVLCTQVNMMFVMLL